MRILLTNDDGIHAPGLCALHRALRGRHQLAVVAPEGERSAVGHAITLTDPLRVRRVAAGGFLGWAVNGTPADCVKLGLAELAPWPVDLVVSGINQGANVGINLIYSGTVSAATEAVLLGRAGIACSLDALSRPDFCLAAHLMAEMVEELAGLSTALGRAINVNFPQRPLHEIRGIKAVAQDRRPFLERFERRRDPRGNIYYWHSSQGPPQGACGPTDLTELKRGYITVTPVGFILSDHRAVEGLREGLAEVARRMESLLG